MPPCLGKQLSSPVLAGGFEMTREEHEEDGRPLPSDVQLSVSHGRFGVEKRVMSDG